jgi:hypothetical protein
MQSSMQHMDPNAENAFWIPDLHNFDCKDAGELRVRKEAD